MSTIEQRLYDTLSSDANITALTALRIYPVVIPETTDYPCISYQVISGREISTLNHDLPTLRFKRVQVNIWAKKYNEVKTLEDLVATALYTGEIKGHVENYRDSEDKELKIFGSSVDFISNNYKLSFDILVPAIEYDFKTVYTDYDSTRYFLDISEGIQNNAEMFTGQGYKPNGVDQTIPYTPIGATHTIYTFNGTMQYLAGVLNLNSVLPTGIYQNVIYFNFDLSQAQKDAYANNPETFLYRENGVLKSDTLSQAEIDNVVAYLPMCEKDEYVRDLANYSEVLTNTKIEESNYTNINNFKAVVATATLVNGNVRLTDNSEATSTPRFVYKNDNGAEFEAENNTYYMVKAKITNLNGATSVKIKYDADTNLNAESLRESSIIPADTDFIFIYKSTIIDKKRVGLIQVNNVDGCSYDVVKFEVIKLSGIYPIQNFTNSCRDDAKNLNKGLQTSKWERDSLGIPTGLSPYCECDKIGNAVIPSHTTTANVTVEVYPRELVGSVLSGAISFPASGLILNQWNTVALSSQSINGTITLGEGFNGIIRKYKETEV